LRYIVCRNPRVAIEQKRDREEDLAYLKEQLEQLKKKDCFQKETSGKNDHPASRRDIISQAWQAFL
jgi:hypothetical protein